VGRRAPRSRLWGLAVLGVLGLHAATKVPAGQLTEMLWMCHVSAALIGAGLLLARPALAAVGFLSHLAVGTPAYLLDVAVQRATTATSLAAHVVPLGCGWLVVRRWGLPRRAALWAFALFVALLPISYFLADPRLDVNLSRAAWPPLRGVLPRPWMAWLANAAAAAAALGVGDRLLRAHTPTWPRSARD
jgi:hypothetical protein